ncbi:MULTISPECIES: MFS transporter [unclassified Pseudomonas]|uniref:MFS transporter n=1 Tax=unclassified Pseudomonas TaxID=196821 RepID=UPI00128B5F2F|nr:MULTISPECIES: MFS transporter [unclassified Pseudomonas]MPQ65881.1 MFS transporter [Pseudomonas sp. MWU12-2323]
MHSVIFNKKIFPLSCSSLISKTGDFAYEVAFALIAIELLSFEFFYLGIIYFFRFIPYLLFGPVGGWLADAFPQKYNMLGSDFLRFVIAAILYFIYISGGLSIYILVISSMAMTIARSLFQPSFRAYLPYVLEERDLPAGNSLLQLIEDVASILGPLICSLIIASSEKSNVICFYAVSYLLSIIFLLCLQVSRPGKHSSHFSCSVVFLEARNTLVDICTRNQNLFMVVAGTSVCVLFVASLLRFVLPASIISIYGDEALVGYIFSLMSFGTVLGSLCYTWLVRCTTPIQLMKAWMVYGFLFLMVSIVIKFHLASVFVVVFFLGFSGAIVDISIITNIQTLSVKGELGKNYGIYSTIANTCEAVSGLFSGVFSLLVGGASFSIISLLITLAARAVIFKIKRIEHEKEK